MIRPFVEKHGATAGGLTLALFNNTSASNGKALPPGIYKTDRVKTLLDIALGSVHGNVTATHYKFTGTIGLMDAAGVRMGCVGPVIAEGVRARRMNRVFATPKGVGTPKQFVN